MLPYCVMFPAKVTSVSQFTFFKYIQILSGLSKQVYHLEKVESFALKAHWKLHTRMPHTRDSLFKNLEKNWKYPISSLIYAKIRNKRPTIAHYRKKKKKLIES